MLYRGNQKEYFTLERGVNTSKRSQEIIKNTGTVNKKEL